MPIPETKMPDEFYDWLDQCPTQWFRIQVNENSIDYSFVIPEPSTPD
tara:strand:- start:615 stop:755 length:141 start_codon:yes stop_codon:yes gene_type:complete